MIFMIFFLESMGHFKLIFQLSTEQQPIFLLVLFDQQIKNFASLNVIIKIFDKIWLNEFHSLRCLFWYFVNRKRRSTFILWRIFPTFLSVNLIGGHDYIYTIWNVVVILGRRYNLVDDTNARHVHLVKRDRRRNVS